MKVRYAPLAEDDLDEIAEFTRRTWGERQADRYLGEMESYCDRLAAHPGIGRKCDAIRPGLRRMEQGSHVIFFEANDHGIVIARILHKDMMAMIADFSEESL